MSECQELSLFFSFDGQEPVSGIQEQELNKVKKEKRTFSRLSPEQQSFVTFIPDKSKGFLELTGKIMDFSLGGIKWEISKKEQFSERFLKQFLRAKGNFSFTIHGISFEGYGQIIRIDSLKSHIAMRILEMNTLDHLAFLRLYEVLLLKQRKDIENGKNYMNVRQWVHNFNNKVQAINLIIETMHSQLVLLEKQLNNNDKQKIQGYFQKLREVFDEVIVEARERYLFDYCFTMETTSIKELFEKINDFGVALSVMNETDMSLEEISFPGNYYVLKNVFENLIKNASEANAQRVDIILRANPPWLEVLVNDDGQGIPAELVDSIFKPGFSSKNKNDDKSPPLDRGLGLFFIKEIMKRLGGNIELVNRSNPTSFLLRFPLTLGG